MSLTVEPSFPTRAKATLLLGLGNDILGDDAVGLRIARELGRRLPPDGDAEAVESCEMGLSLLDLMVGYKKLVLVDSVKSGRAPVGTIHDLPVTDIEILPLMSPHFFGIGEILSLGRQLALPMPQDVRVCAIEVEDPFTVRDTMTPALETEFPRLVEAILKTVAG